MYIKLDNVSIVGYKSIQYIEISKFKDGIFYMFPVINNY
jgi:hypothetical protein